MDPRLTPFNGRVAAAHLRGLVEAEHYAEGAPRAVAAPVVDLLRAPDGARDRQLVAGEAVTVYDTQGAHRFVQAQKDGYVGYLPAEALTGAAEPTHMVCVPAGHAYTQPDIKSPEAHPLYFGARLRIVAHMPKFYETAAGSFVPKPHLRALDQRFRDPVTVAQMFFGAPYLWGGNTVAGIDCSGLVQAGLLACGAPCPGDSDLQERAFPEADGAPQRGDLFFWKGHVAIAVDVETLIHANAHHMAVAYEPIDKAVRRIEAQGDGPVTSRRRPVLPGG